MDPLHGVSTAYGAGTYHAYTSALVPGTTVYLLVVR